MHKQRRSYEVGTVSRPRPLDDLRIVQALPIELEREIVRGARAGVGAAEIRRRLVPIAARLGVPRPGYTAVRVLVAACRDDLIYEIWESTASPLDSLVQGRMPTPYEVEQLLERRLRRRLVN